MDVELRRLQNGLTILPAVNLTVSNIGFREPRHPCGTTRHSAIWSSLAFPLKHPPYVVRDAAADWITQRTLFRRPNLWQRVAYRIRHIREVK